jgi:hypothetical protein
MQTTYYPFEVAGYPPGGPATYIAEAREDLVAWAAGAPTAALRAAQQGNCLDNHHLWLALAQHVNAPVVRDEILQGLWRLFHDLVELAMKTEAEEVWDIVVQHTAQDIKGFATIWPQTLDLVLDVIVRIPALTVLPSAVAPSDAPEVVSTGEYKHHKTGEILRLVDRFGDGTQACTCPKCGAAAPADTFGWRMSRQGPKGRKYFLKRPHSWCKACRTVEARVYRAAKKLKASKP